MRNYAAQVAQGTPASGMVESPRVTIPPLTAHRSQMTSEAKCVQGRDCFNAKGDALTESRVVDNVGLLTLLIIASTVNIQRNFLWRRRRVVLNLYGPAGPGRRREDIAASTTHHRLSGNEQVASGATPDPIRVSPPFIIVVSRHEDLNFCACILTSGPYITLAPIILPRSLTQTVILRLLYTHRQPPSSSSNLESAFVRFRSESYNHPSSHI
ncbi:hypothetical protein K439DRAFT_1633766 [Ramaria rubella]|nr:hypothetical protein K439DRAFT_1633766 [Ramaria rubella]